MDLQLSRDTSRPVAKVVAQRFLTLILYKPQQSGKEKKYSQQSTYCTDKSKWMQPRSISYLLRASFRR